MTADQQLLNNIARIIEEAAIRHGVDEQALEGTLDDAEQVLALISKPKDDEARIEAMADRYFYEQGIEA